MKTFNKFFGNLLEDAAEDSQEDSREKDSLRDEVLKAIQALLDEMGISIKAEELDTQTNDIPEVRILKDAGAGNIPNMEKDDIEKMLDVLVKEEGLQAYGSLENLKKILQKTK